MQVVRKINKPSHNKYLLRNLPNATYCKYANVYGDCKKWGVKGVYTFLTGTGLWGIVKDMAKGQIVQYGKRRLAVFVIGVSSYVCAPAVAVLTNATPVVKTCQVVFTIVGYVAEVVEDASQVTFLPLDMLIFGQPIPANEGGRYTNWSNMTDIISNLPGIDED